MKYSELTVGGKTYTNQREITKILKTEGFGWLVDSVIEDANIEILNGTLIWRNGLFLEGDWRFGIFKDGRFCGNWEGGIFEAGTFEGKWLGGIRL